MKKLRIISALLLVVALLAVPAYADDDSDDQTLEELLESVGIDIDLPDEIEDIDLSGVDLEQIDLSGEDVSGLLESFQEWRENSVSKSDDEIREEIRTEAAKYGINLTEDQLDQILQLIRTADSIDFEQWQSRLEKLQKNWKKLVKISNKAKQVAEDAKPILKATGKAFERLGSVFESLFGK